MGRMVGYGIFGGRKLHHGLLPRLRAILNVIGADVNRRHLPVSEPVAQVCPAGPATPKPGGGAGGNKHARNGSGARRRASDDGDDSESSDSEQVMGLALNRQPVHTPEGEMPRRGATTSGVLYRHKTTRAAAPIGATQATQPGHAAAAPSAPAAAANAHAASVGARVAPPLGFGRGVPAGRVVAKRSRAPPASAAAAAAPGIGDGHRADAGSEDEDGDASMGVRAEQVQAAAGPAAAAEARHEDDDEPMVRRLFEDPGSAGAAAAAAPRASRAAPKAAFARRGRGQHEATLAKAAAAAAGSSAAADPGLAARIFSGLVSGAGDGGDGDAAAYLLNARPLASPLVAAVDALLAEALTVGLNDRLGPACTFPRFRFMARDWLRLRPVDRDVERKSPTTFMLNDDIINRFMILLELRDKERFSGCPGRLRQAFFYSDLHTKLMEEGEYSFKSVRNHGCKRGDIFIMEKLFFPINISGSHWTLIVAYPLRKMLEWYDSMGGDGSRCVDLLRCAHLLLTPPLPPSSSAGAWPTSPGTWTTSTSSSAMSSPPARGTASCRPTSPRRTTGATVGSSSARPPCSSRRTSGSSSSATASCRTCGAASRTAACRTASCGTTTRWHVGGAPLLPVRRRTPTVSPTRRRRLTRSFGSRHPVAAGRPRRAPTFVSAASAAGGVDFTYWLQMAPPDAHHIGVARARAHGHRGRPPGLTSGVGSQ